MNNINDIVQPISPIKSELFGDLVAPVMSKFEHPIVIDMAYQKYLTEVTKPTITPIDKTKSAITYNRSSYMTPEQFKETGQYRNWTPLLKKQRGPIEAITESAKRNSYRINLDQSVKEARMAGRDPEEIYRQMEKDDLLNLVDPIEGILPATAGVIGGQWQTAKEEGLTGAIIGASVGTVAAAPTAGTAVPLTAPIGASLGFRAGVTYGWYKQGSGALSYQFWKRGNTSQSADFIADSAAIPYALLELLQLDKIAIPFAKTVGKTIGKTQIAKEASEIIIKRWPDIFTKLLPKMGKECGKAMASEVGTEHIQDAINMLAEDLGNYLNDQGVPYDKKLIKDRAKQLYENTKLYTKSFTLLPIVGTAMSSYADMHVDLTDLTEMNNVGLSADQLRGMVAPAIAQQKQQKIAVLQKMADTNPEEFNKAYDSLSPEEQKALVTELQKAKQIRDVVEETGTPYPTQDDIDLAVGSLVPMNQAVQISPVVLSPQQITNIETNINSRVEGEVTDKAYIKGFAARLTSIRNTADNMTGGAGNPEAQLKVLETEITSVVDGYTNIDELITQNPETLKELAQIKEMIPGYEDAVRSFMQEPSEDGFEQIKTIGDEIAQLGQTYADRVSRSTIGLEEKTNVTSTIVKTHNEKGGSTINLETGKPVTEGFAVAISKDYEAIIPGEKLTAEQLDEYKAKHADVLAADNRRTVGTWVDSGNTYLDISTVVSTQAEAEELGRANKQLAIFNLGTFETIPIESKEKVDQEDKIVHRVVSRFPAKIKDTASLTSVGNLIAKDMGVDTPITWRYFDVNSIPSTTILIRQKYNMSSTEASYMLERKNQGGTGGYHYVVDGKHYITIVAAHKLSEGVIPKKSKQFVGFKPGREAPSQANIKKTIVHELGHIAAPAKMLTSGIRSVHHRNFATWVGTNTDRLFGYREGDIIIPGKQKTSFIEKLPTPEEQNNVSDAIGGGEEIAADGTVKAPVTKEEAISALKLMLSEFKDASKDRISEIKRLRAKQYAIMNNILEKYVSSKTYAKALGSIKDVVADISFDWTNPISDAVYEKLSEIISTRYKDSFRQITAWKALNALRAGESLTFSEKQVLSGAFNLTPDMIPVGTRKYGIGDVLIEAWNVPRMLLAGFFDNSMLLRQMFPAFWDSPILWTKSAGMSMKALFMPEYTQKTLADIYNRPNFEMYQVIGIDITGPGSGVENTAETNVGGSFLQYMPHKKTEGIAKKVLKSIWNVSTSPYRSAMRAADVSTNTFRVNCADFYINLNKGQLNPHTEYGQKQWKYLGNSINRLTGRTNMGGNPSLKKLSAVLQPTMFSMQLQVSRIMLLATGTRATGDRLLSAITKGKYQGRYDPFVRKAISNSFLKVATGIVGTVTLAAYLWPGAVGDDPEQSGYGKVKIGNTYYDLTAGFGQYVRSVAQMMSGKKRSITGNRYTVGRGAIMQQFARSKAAPSVNIVWDAFTGRKVTGEPVDWSTKEGVFTNLWNYFGPMIMQDTMDLVNNDPYQTAPGMLLAFVGGGVQSYPLLPSQQAVIMKKKLAMETFGKDWDELGPALQKALYTIHPELELQDRVVKATRSDWNSISLRTTESQLAGKKVMKALPKFVQQELIDLNLTVGGLSRQVGSSSYFLNETRFDVYRDDTAAMLNNILPKIVESSEYQSLESGARYKLMEALIKKVKMVARNEVLNKTKTQDMQTLQEMRK